MALSAAHTDLLTERYQGFFEPELLQDIALHSEFRQVPKDRIILDIGDLIGYMPIILNGSLKIMREDPQHQELLLYYLEYGDTCAMTLNCCMRKTRSQIRAITEQDSDLVLIPVEKMEDWMVKHPSWRTYVLDSYNVRLNEMLEAIDVLAFMNMEERIFKYLREKAMVNSSDELHTTHQEIANDLHTSRVVVSRLLKKLEQQGKIQTRRNQIQVLSL